MAKFQSPLLGYNNNVRHKNRVFHIQTEDSGVNHPHIITHLFMDGGRILKSVKKSYAEHVGSETMSEMVRQLMKDQHKAMFVALREGQFDHLFDPGATSTRKPENSASGATSVRTAEGKAQDPNNKPPLDIASANTSEIVAAPSEIGTGTSSETKPLREIPKGPAIRPRTSPAIAASAVSKPGDADGPPTQRRPESVPALSPSPAAVERQETPPPPGVLPKEPTAGAYRTSDASAKHQIERVPIAATRTSAVPTPPKRPSSRPPVEGRYAPARPASIFDSPSSSTRPPPASIFSDDLISDKSLDEVILSYLAEDLEPPRRK